MCNINYVTDHLDTNPYSKI